MRRFRPSPALAVALLALFVALGGTGYAALTITGAQVRNSSLTGADIRNASLTGADVRDRSLRAADFAAGQLPSGARGETGAAGPKGDRGPAGPNGSIQGAPAAGDLAGTFPAPTIKPGAVGTAAVGDGSLRLADVAFKTGTYVLDPAAVVAPDSCYSAGLAGSYSEGVSTGDLVVASATGVNLLSSGFVLNASIYGANPALLLSLCNVRATGSNPGAITVRYAVFKP